jgi:glutamate-ammonia-ligase adenylyltransferase
VLKKELKKYLLELSARYFSSGKEKLIAQNIDKLLDSIFVSQRVINNLKRISESDYYKSVYAEKVESFLIYLEVILKISAYSNYLTDIVVRNPEFLTRFLSSDELQRNFSSEDYSDELKSQLQIFKSFEKKIDAIRRFKRMHILRIGLRDILRLCDIEQSMLEYSELTRTILENVFELVLYQQKQKTNLVTIPEYTLIALGKFGGNELNYSSDVDLICVYDNPEEKFNSEVLEFYDKVIKDFIQVCSELKDGSSLYRIDFRLRPDGKYSPLARSLAYYQIYYETYGRDWERQMLLKMNYCAGSKKLFDKFYSMLQNFVYPRTLFEPPQSFVKKFREIQKEKFDQESLSKNLKHFEGGIRDVEFSIQVIQLLRGGKLVELRTPNTIEAIQMLQKNKLIQPKQARELIDAYKFLRRIENFIQLMDDRQTHSIPDDEDKLQNLIKFLGFKSISEFNKKLDQTRKLVREHHDQVFEFYGDEEDTIKIKSSIKTSNFIDFQNKLFMVKNLILNNITFRMLQVSDDAIKSFENTLAKHIEKSQDPDQFILNLLKFLMQVKTSSHISELLNNKPLAKLLFEILENSEPLTNKLISNPLIFDFFFSGRAFDKIIVDEYFNSFNENEVERFLFSLMINYFNQTISPDEIGELLSKFIDELIVNIVSRNLKSLKLKEDDFLIVGLGSYGTKEMHFKSDIDLLFVFDPKIKIDKSENFSRKILAAIRDKFKLYDFFNADSRLRPEGSVSKLSWTIDELEKYISDRMRVWEFQSYTKMRMITGNQMLFKKLKDGLMKKISMLDKDFVALEIKRNKDLIKKDKIQIEPDEIDLKNSSGGLMDIQFFIQYLILKNPTKFFMNGRSNNELLVLASKNLKEFSSSLKILQKHYLLIRKLILYQQVLSGKRSFILSKKVNLKILDKIFRIKKSHNIFDYFHNLMKQNTEILKQISPEIF